MKRFILTLSVGLFFALGFLAVSVQAQEAQLPKTCIPANKMDQAWWKARHEANCARIEQGNVDLLLIGDSITHGWDGAGAEIQQFFYGGDSPEPEQSGIRCDGDHDETGQN